MAWNQGCAFFGIVQIINDFHFYTPIMPTAPLPHFPISISISAPEAHNHRDPQNSIWIYRELLTEHTNRMPTARPTKRHYMRCSRIIIWAVMHFNLFFSLWFGRTGKWLETSKPAFSQQTNTPSANRRWKLSPYGPEKLPSARTLSWSAKHFGCCKRKTSQSPSLHPRAILVRFIWQQIPIIVYVYSIYVMA